MRFGLFFTASRYFFGGKNASLQGASHSNEQFSKQNVVLPLWQPENQFKIQVFVSENEVFRGPFDSTHLIWEESDLALNWEKSNDRYTNLTFPTTLGLRQNGTLFAHVYFTKKGYSADPESKDWRSTTSFQSTIPLNIHRKRFKVKGGDGKNLLAKVDGSEQITDPNEIVSYWRPALPIRLILDFTPLKDGVMPAEFLNHYRVEKNSGRYFPTVYFEYFWMLQDNMILLNETVSEVPLEISFKHLSLFRWQLQSQMEVAWKQQHSMGSSESETEEFRRILLETNPYYLAITFFVSMLHMVFDFLAFKNDVQFWKDKKDMEGLSLRTIFLNCFCQVIIFLYLLDNETSWMILLSSGVGILIEFWKIRQAADCVFEWRNLFGIPYPWINVNDKQAYVQSNTAKYDKEAMTYMSYALYPLVICYALYSLYYEKHKSWYSWVLGSLTGSVYAFGFVMMCPQLYLNYKLKSVAHLPWRMLTYKALNTFIDDMFAFIIKMPTMHRLSCFRDDIVFFIYLYQRYIYRVDYSRTNEFGYQPVKDDSSNALADADKIADDTDDKLKTE